VSEGLTKLSTLTTTHPLKPISRNPDNSTLRLLYQLRPFRHVVALNCLFYAQPCEDQPGEANADMYCSGGKQLLENLPHCVFGRRIRRGADGNCWLVGWAGNIVTYLFVRSQFGLDFKPSSLLCPINLGILGEF
jgi:hypothetical protein